MEAFSDDEFYEARDEISSVSGSDESSPDEDDAAAEISGRHHEPQQQQKQQQRSGSRRQQHQQERANKPPRHNQPPQWLAESRFSVWQDGPKSIQERRRLLYERFGILGRKGEGGEGGDNAPTSPEGTQIRLTRFGIRGEHVSPGRKGVGRTWNSSAGITSTDPPPLNKPNGLSTDRNTDNAVATPAASSGGSDENAKPLHSSSEGLKVGLKDVDPVTLGRSRSDSAALLAGGKLGIQETGAISRSASASPQFLPGIDRLTQTSGAVLREGRRGGPSNSKPPTGSRALGSSKSAPSSLRNLGGGHQEEGSSNGAQALSVLDRQDGHPNASIGSPASESPIRSLTKGSKISVGDESPAASQTWGVGDESALGNGQLGSNSVGGLVDGVQTMAASAANDDHSPFSDRNSNDVAYKIKDLDSGKEFIIDEYGADGDPKLRELDTGKELTLKEFESSLGLSPVMQEVRRREREQDSLNDDDVAQGHHDSTASSKKKKKKSLWVTMKGVAKTVGGVSKSKSNHDSSRLPNEGSRGESGGEEREGSVGKESQREGSFDKCRRPRTKSVSEDIPEPLRPRSPQRVKVQVNKKNYKDLSDLYMGQEIQAHQGAIWTMKFSMDGRYLASAGQDQIVHVREVLDHPFAKDQGAGDGLESSGGKGDRIAATTPEHLQHSQSQEGSQGRRASLRGSVKKRKSAKRSSSAKLPKLFWLSETAVCSFKGHTADVLDLSWSRTQFLLSSSMDQTVRLWHMSYNECLRVFTHNDYVTTIAFSPTDDRYFVSGSLDDKVRLWNIPDHQVVDWSDVREMVTAASYSPDGKRAVIGTYKGTCRFYNTTGQKLKLERQIDVRNAQSKKSRGKKITGLQFVPGDPNKVLITSNDSRVRVYEGSELSLKFKGLRNINTQISASFSRSGEYIVSASEDSRVYIWNSGLQEFRGSRKDKPQSYENFPSSHVSIALPWSGMDPPSAVGVPKEDQSELDTSSSRQSTNDGPLLSPLRCSPCSSSSSSSNGSTHSESGLTSESVGECKSEQSITFSIRNGSGRDMGDGEEVTSRRSDTNGSFLGHYDKVETLHSSFRESALREGGTRPSASSPALSVSNDSPPLGLTSLRTPSPSFFADVTTPKGGSATWPEEKLPPLQQDSARSQGGSWSASSPSQDILSTELSPEGSTAGDAGTTSTVASWGLVIVTASLSGEIRAFQNYGYPIRL